MRQESWQPGSYGELFAVLNLEEPWTPRCIRLIKSWLASMILSTNFQRLKEIAFDRLMSNFHQFAD